MVKRVDLAGMMFAPQIASVLFQALAEQVTVTRWCYTSRANDGLDLEFEIRVTKVGTTKMPRMVKSQGVPSRG